jgi:hypothetical protein
MNTRAPLLVVALVLVCTLADLIREFSANNTPNYFSSEPRRLLYVAGFAVAGGLLALAFSRLSRQMQRSVRLFGRGATASLLTAFGTDSLYQTISLLPVIGANSGGWLLLVVALLAAFATYLWFEFFHEWKTRVTDLPGRLTTKGLKGPASERSAPF